MGSTVVNAPPDKVFEAVSDLTRPANWAAHEIVITGDQEGPVAVGHTFSSVKNGGKPDRITITSVTPNEGLGFHVVMPNSWELDWQISLTSQVDGTKVDRSVRITKMPWYMSPMKLVVAAVGPIFEKKMAKNMKAELESSE